jgi:hypothetical protein
MRYESSLGEVLDFAGLCVFFAFLVLAVRL